MKSYFTFGQVHLHNINGVIFDKDCVVEIEAPNQFEARTKMIEAFGQKWAFQYSDLDKVNLRFYSRGVIPLEPNKEAADRAAAAEVGHGGAAGRGVGVDVRRFPEAGEWANTKPERPMMACGHAANATMKLPTGDVPACTICVTTEQETLPVDLTGRMSKCVDCDRIQRSSTNLPFFKHRPEQAFDSHNDMCRGCD